MHLLHKSKKFNVEAQRIFCKLFLILIYNTFLWALRKAVVKEFDWLQ